MISLFGDVNFCVYQRLSNAHSFTGTRDVFITFGNSDTLLINSLSFAGNDFLRLFVKFCNSITCSALNFLPSAIAFCISHSFSSAFGDCFAIAFFIAFLLNCDNHTSANIQAIHHNIIQGIQPVDHIATHHNAPAVLPITHCGIVVYAFAISGIPLIADILSHISGIYCNNLSLSFAFAGLFMFSIILSILSLICHFFLCSLYVIPSSISCMSLDILAHSSSAFTRSGFSFNLPSTIFLISFNILNSQLSLFACAFSIRSSSHFLISCSVEIVAVLSKIFLVPNKFHLSTLFKKVFKL